MANRLKIVEKILNIVYPQKCMFCKAPISRYNDDGVCNECIASLPYTQNDGCFETLGGAAYLISPLMYEGSVKRALRELKFKSKYENADILARILSGYLKNVEEVKKADVIVCVPLSPKSLLHRGFNQTQLIAKRVSEELSVALDEAVLVKIRETKRQSTIATAGERALNVDGAYECIQDMSGKTVLLIDDIYTSGMTVCVCARELLKMGAAKVIAATVANAHRDVGVSMHDYKASRLVFKREK